MIIDYLKSKSTDFRILAFLACFVFTVFAVVAIAQNHARLEEQLRKEQANCSLLKQENVKLRSAQPTAVRKFTISESGEKRLIERLSALRPVRLFFSFKCVDPSRNNLELITQLQRIVKDGWHSYSGIQSEPPSIPPIMGVKMRLKEKPGDLLEAFIACLYSELHAQESIEIASDPNNAEYDVEFVIGFSP